MSDSDVGDGDPDGDTAADVLAESVANAVGGWPSISELDTDDTVTLRLGYFVHNGRDTRGVTIQAHSGGRELHDDVTALTERIEPLLDQRKFTVSTDQPKYRQAKSWDIGTVTITGDGEIDSADVETEHLKPSVDAEVVDGENA